jgi:hypothetical protein
MVAMSTGSEVRLPLQGGLPPATRLAGPVVEIACDESGFSGSNLLDPTTPMISHASVDLSVDEATSLIAELRPGLSELKSAQFLRSPGADESLDRFAAALTGRAHVVLVDKQFFLATRIVDLFLGDPSYAAGTRLTEQYRPAARDLYPARHVAGGEWAAFLTSFADLVRTKRRHHPDRVLVGRFLRARDALAAAVAGTAAGTAAASVLADLRSGRVREVLARITHDDRSIPPPLEPMLPALAETVLLWSGGHRQVLVVHDEQSALTPDRLRRLQGVLAVGAGRSSLAGLVTVDSRDDPRVQVADLVAGVARRSAETGDHDGPLGRFVSPTSLWDAGEGVAP